MCHRHPWQKIGVIPTNAESCRVFSAGAQREKRWGGGGGVGCTLVATDNPEAGMTQTANKTQSGEAEGILGGRI